MGWTVLFILSAMNSLYYGDIFYRRVIVGKYAYWGRSFETFWGAQGGLRPLVNYAMWSILGVYASLAIFDNPTFYIMLADAANLMGELWTYRTFAILGLMALGIYADKFKYYDGGAANDIFRR